MLRYHEETDALFHYTLGLASQRANGIPHVLMPCGNVQKHYASLWQNRVRWGKTKFITQPFSLSSKVFSWTMASAAPCGLIRSKTRPSTGRPILKISLLAKGWFEGRWKHACCRGLPRQPDTFSDCLENLLIRVLVMSQKLSPQEQPFWGQNGRNMLWQRCFKLLLFWFKFLGSSKPLLEEKCAISGQLFGRGGGIAINGLLKRLGKS